MSMYTINVGVSSVLKPVVVIAAKQHASLQQSLAGDDLVTSPAAGNMPPAPSSPLCYLAQPRQNVLLQIAIQGVDAQFQGQAVTCSLAPKSGWGGTWAPPIAPSPPATVADYFPFSLPAQSVPFGYSGLYTVTLTPTNGGPPVELPQLLALELYVLPVAKLANIFDVGIPLLLLRMFVLAATCQKLSTPDDWVSMVARIAHGSAQPFTGHACKTNEHWLKYETVGGNPSFAGEYGSGGFNLPAWLDSWRVWNQYKKLTTVNCFDQGAIAQTALSLGVPYEELSWEHHQVYGFIPKTPEMIAQTELVGWGPCNNPFFEYKTSDMVLPDYASPDRQPFRNHVWISWSRGKALSEELRAEFNQLVRGDGNYPSQAAAFEKDHGLTMLMIDSCAGPHTGTESRAEYEATKLLVSTPFADNFSSYVKSNTKSSPGRWAEAHSIGPGVTQHSGGTPPVEHTHFLPPGTESAFSSMIQDIKDQDLPSYRPQDPSQLFTGDLDLVSKRFQALVQNSLGGYGCALTGPVPIRPYEASDGSSASEYKFGYTTTRNPDDRDGLRFVSLQFYVYKSGQLATDGLATRLALLSLTSANAQRLGPETTSGTYVSAFANMRAFTLYNVAVRMSGPLFFADFGSAAATQVAIDLAQDMRGGNY
ncbi:uncharacterized protein UV8b_05801 [Ustilaginoidea virens]|uniref:Uncharacterized protein n=1 Tax=Ustilaginoidea virens TaxID=1159556 RepID=A0A1B5KRU6_USTVR|nr:uncharacterized protein UV8b_05801 [Ustilaginoidea virens]QUC21558.1 hypothetical protein UV8b_05801 [Ustilaginoidea virens]GAO13528.1 hypothetical protein UVI_02015960 [Ustilaginoidea virens]